MPQSADFEALPLPHKAFPVADAGSYRVYSDGAKFIRVTAMNALEAMQSSGVDTPLKIERDSLDLTRVFGPKDWDAHVPAGDAAPAVAETAAAPEAPAAEEPAAGQKDTVEVPLSNDEVSKLLDGN